MAISIPAALRHFLTITIAFVLVSFGSIHIGWADTEISGIINSDQTWTIQNSPFLITDNTTVAYPVTLTVEAGVEVRFTGPYWMKVEGTLLAQGSVDAEIVFTANDANTYWHRLELLPGSDASALDYVDISNAGNTSSSGSQAYGALYLAGTSPLLNHLRIHNNRVTGLYAENISTDLALNDSEVTNNVNNTTAGVGAGGVFMEATPTANLSISNNKIVNNRSNSHGGGLYLSGAGSTFISDNHIANNHAEGGFGYGGGLYVANLGGDLTKNTIANNTIIDNIADKDGGGIWIDESQVTVSDNVVQGNRAQDSQGGALYIGDSNSLDLTRSVSAVQRNLFYDNYSLEMGGAIYIENGTHTIADNVFYGNTADDAGGAITNEQGGALMVRDATVNFNNNVVADNAAANGGAINLSGSGNLSNNSFSHNFSRHILRLTGSITVHGNTFADNVGELSILFVPPQLDPIPVVNNNNFFYAISNESIAYLVDNLNESLLNAQSNWWGTTDEQEIAWQVSDTTDYSGYSLEPLTDTPLAPPEITTASFTADTAELTWDGRGEPDVTGYKVYWGESPAPEWDNMLDTGTDTRITITQLLPTKAYYFAVTAYDNDAGNDTPQTQINEDQLNGNESWYSQPVYKAGATIEDVSSGGGGVGFIFHFVCFFIAIARLREAIIVSNVKKMLRIRT
jgi:parallel beta-helix repeat protein